MKGHRMQVINSHLVVRIDWDEEHPWIVRLVNTKLGKDMVLHYAQDEISAIDFARDLIPILHLETYEMIG